ncbi:MAG: YggS family pyridoxal phosphate-dependent enzyme [Oscillospiraceae bacterium]
MSITENVKSILERIEFAAKAAGVSARDVSLVAATKMNDAAAVAEAISAGVSACGENRVQELITKNAQNAYAGAPIHFIGHLQKNKVNQVVGICDIIESVDSAELLELINKRAALLGIKQSVLLEVNIAGEDSKSGLLPDELERVLSKAADYPSVLVRGLMAIPPISSKKGENRPYFAGMYKLSVDIRKKKYDNVFMDFLSMGMSGDFEDAIAEGSNMVRVGSAIFGARTYPQSAI